MEIRQLRLSGFKSFVEPATLRIEPGLTGIVGPNGCGKSNLLEAIRWVMGENSPKSMRSGGMEDVIFAGTASRPPRDFAEVVLSGSDNDGEELEVVRRIERGAGSAYRVNGQDVRAKDVSLTFADAATGAHSPALVSQGKIAQVIAAKPAERRQMLEEAAGIAGLHVRRRDAESKLRQTEANLARLEDLMAGQAARIAALRRQARQAERYRELSDRIQTAEGRLIFARWRDAASAAKQAKAEASKAEERVTQAQDQINGAQEAQRKSAEALAAARDERADRRDDASAHAHRMATLASQLESAEQRLADLQRQKRRLEEDRADADQITRDAAQALGRLEDETAKAARELAGDEERLPALRTAAEGAEQAARKAELALANAQAENAAIEAEWRVASARIEQAETQMARARGEAERRDRQRGELGSLAEHEAHVRDAQGNVETARSAVDTARARKAELEQRKQELQSREGTASAKVAAANADLVGKEREYAALKRDAETCAKQSVRDGQRTMAFDRLRAKPGFERALAAALGRDGKALIGQPDADEDGRFWSGRDGAAPLPESIIAHLDDFPQELAARLGSIHCVERDDGRRLEPGEWLVTTAGQLRRWDGFIARGEGQAEAARLEADNRLRQLERDLPALRGALAEAKEAEQAVRWQSEELGREVIAQDRALNDAQNNEREALRALDQAEAAHERLSERLSELDARVEEDRETIQHAEVELRKAQEARAALPNPATGREALKEVRETVENARTKLQSALAQVAAQEQAIAIARERVAAQRSEMATWNARSGDAARRLKEAARRLEEIDEEIAVAAVKPVGLQRELEQGEAARDRIASDLASAERALAAAEEDLRQADSAFGDANETASKAREDRAALLAKAENQELRRQEMGRISGEKFQTPPPLLPQRFDFDEAEIASVERESEQLDALSASRERIGPVNLVAADELRAIETEQGASETEREELAEAVSRLRGSIGSLNREGRERLREAFAQVDTHFRRLFAQLFEGGQAHLAMIDSDDPLEAGLEIYAQPPGKRLQSLSLLSGGEQALTAVALIFALFLTNPAPICVLDEVDAPLDDANIDRFCDLLDAMVQETNTRYLIVTHNAVTMSRMHRLFGVTMIERGISRLVSVDLGGAETLLAAE